MPAPPDRRSQAEGMTWEATRSGRVNVPRGSSSGRSTGKASTSRTARAWHVAADQNGRELESL
ncbi:MAG: hypothetical protein ACRDVZ_17495 [Jiangellaceae bacterium]